MTDHDPTTSYDNELESERRYVTALHARVDAERIVAQRRYTAALRNDAASPMERDVEVRALARQIRRLDAADDNLCFGRLDSDDGECSYVGRIGLFDESDDHTPLLIDWRAPAARPFYTATGAHPEGLRRRRRFRSRGRVVTGLTDEHLGDPRHEDVGRDAESALLAAVNAPRGEGMRDIVATIQAEQDAIIRLDHPGVLVVEGGPGTGKTAVALHRVAYLLYTQRQRMERHGVLVVGPNPVFLNHISRVLPSLGESDVVFTTTGGLFPGLHVTAEDAPGAATLKGALEILDVLAAAVAHRQRLPERPITIGLSDTTVRLDPDIAEWARDEARASGRPHNEARAVFEEIVTWALTERAITKIGHGWLDRNDHVAREQFRRDLVAELASHDTYVAATEACWPILTPESLLAELYTSRELLAAAGADETLWRTDGAAWTVSDVPLLDELADVLGSAPSDGGSTERRSRADTEYAAGVLDLLVDRTDHMDDEDHLFATDLLYAEDLADRFVARDTRDVAERAAADREWTYRHVVVDEAQELSAMDWRVLMRRCPDRSFTVVGDLAQRRSPAGATSWATMLDPHVPGRWVYRSLTVNYRTPSEIMAVAASVLTEFAPGAAVPESVRSCGVTPWAKKVTDEELPRAVDEFVRSESERPGTAVVIGPPDVPGTVPVAATKGLEFDSVLVVDPDRILADSPRGAAELYVALTRATQRLGILHRAPLSRSRLRGPIRVVSMSGTAAERSGGLP